MAAGAPEMNTKPSSPSDWDELAPAERVNDIPRMLAALTQAVQEALAEHKGAGNPVAIWRNDRVEWVQPEDTPVSFEAPEEDCGLARGSGQEEP
jgi:hypothetical protein